MRVDAVTFGGRHQRALAGGKAANLGEMIAAGLPVPRGFCVTTAAPPAVLAAWRELGEEKSYAVRSSATVEDGSKQSFAGQFESVLNVRGAEALLAAIETCRQSLHSDRARAYLARLPVEHVTMAVIVQEMVDAEHAGVIFTTDPVTGAGRFVVESVAGLGDKLVQGVAQPERVVLDRQTNSGQFAKLCELARQVERLFGAPQDIEWAERGGEFFLLQARPITARRTWEDRQVWSNMNTGEVFPDVATPMTWSLIESCLNYTWCNSLFRLVGADLRRARVAPLAGLVAGRVYSNLNTISAMARPFAFVLGDAPLEAYARAFGGGHFQKRYNVPPVIPPEDLPDVGFRWPKYIWSWPRIAYDLVTHSPRRGDAWLAGLKTQKLDPKKPPAELAREVFADADLLYLITQAVDLPAFEKASRERLLAGLGGLPTVEASFDLWRLAQLDGTEQFAGAWDEFMAKHGHHCRGELELANARWSETPDYVRGLLRGMGQTDPRENHRKLAAERERLTEECRRRLKNPIKRWVFMRSLRRAQKWAVFREQLKDLFIQRIAVLRQALLAFGRHRSMPDGDVFFLKVSELETMDSFDWRARIAERRREYEANQKLMPPPVVVGRVDSKLNDGQPLPADAKSLEGIPASPGVVTGPARVILRTDDHEQVLPGEILIAPFTDPAWTPYFINAAGVVMDQGGILSHGSIIAREYGLPAVTNVHCATRVIRTGDRVQVDGNRGRVAVLSGL